MALSMDEQRMLAEIERRLSAEDPGLAARLSSFKRPGPALSLRSPRVRIVGSVLTVALVAVVSLMVYAMIPLRAHSGRTYTGHQQASPATNPVMTVPGASAGAGNTPAGMHATAAGTKTTASVRSLGASAVRQSARSRTPRAKATKTAMTPAVRAP